MKLTEGPPQNKYPCGIDADIISYRAAFSGETLQDSFDKCDEVIWGVLSKVSGDFPNLDKVEFYLTGKGNFRYSICQDYKANRPKGEKPERLDPVRQYLVDEWGAQVVTGIEADDAIATRATEEGHKYIIASTDKDFMQVPCWIYNWGQDQWYLPSQEDAHRSLYTQMLTGDRVDNIKGLHRVGPVKANKILEDCTTEESMWEAVVKAYEGDTETLIKNARLLYLRRYPEELWEPKF